MENGGKIRVLVVESHYPLCHVIRQLLENHPQIEVVAEADSEKAAISRAVFYQPDVVLVDSDSRSLNGFRISLTVKRTLPQVKVVLIADEDSDDYRKAAQDSEASACVARNRMDKDLVAVIRSILK